MKENLKNNLFLYLKYALFQTFLFVAIYGTTNYLSEHHLYSCRFYFPLELQIPFFPFMIIFYLSLNLLMLMPLFFLDHVGLKNLNRLMTLTTFIAGFIFLIFPAPCGFNRVEVTGFFAPVFKSLYSIDKSGNTFPSLHITFSFIIVRLITKNLVKLKYLFWIWFGLISLSVLFTHQHHFLDILGGILLAEYSYRKFRIQDIQK